MNIAILFIIISIIWLWVGTRFYFLRSCVNWGIAGMGSDSSDVKDILKHRTIEKKAKLITTIALIFLGLLVYFSDDKSNVVIYVLILGWLLFYFINLEISLVYEKLEKLLKESIKHRQEIWTSIMDIEDKTNNKKDSFNKK
ncbi:MAG: hypothetical protein WCI41_01620 [bacterium]